MDWYDKAVEREERRLTALCLRRIINLFISE